MKSALLGRIVFGVSAVLWGVITLIWRDEQTWQGLPIPMLPFGAVIGGCFAIAQIAGGIAIMYPRTARSASIVLATVYALFALTHIPDIIGKPGVYERYSGFFEQLSLACGAIAVYAATETSAARSAVLGRAVRLALGVCAISFMLTQAIYLHATAGLVPKWIPPDQMFWAVLTTIAFGLAAVAMLINYQARLAMRLMALMTALFGVLIWIPIVVTYPQVHFNWSELAINFLITGATWIVADLRSF